MSEEDLSDKKIDEDKMCIRDSPGSAPANAAASASGAAAGTTTAAAGDVYKRQLLTSRGVWR